MAKEYIRKIPQDMMLRACNVLMVKHLAGRKAYLPKVFVISNEIYFVRAAALRRQKEIRVAIGIKVGIEEVGIEEAYQIVHRGGMPDAFRATVDWDFNSEGYLFEGNKLFNERMV